MNQNHKKLLQTALVIAGVVAAATVQAGADATFSGPVTQIKGWLTGSLGTMMAVGALGVGLGASIMRQTLTGIVVGGAVALAAKTGPDVLATITNMTI